MATVNEIVGYLRLKGGEEFQKQLRSKTESVKQSFANLNTAIAATGVALFIRNVNEAANALTASQNKLAATSRLTGVSLSSLTNVAKDAESAFGLTAKQASEFTISLSKLTGKAGDISKTGDAIGRLLDLAAAQGLGAEEAMLAINQAILGIDEGTDKLFQKNPSAIYAEFAKQIGTTAGKLTDQQKAQALLNAVMNDGLKVSGEWQKRMSTDAGQQERLAAQVTRMRESIGEMVQQIGGPLISMLSGAVNWFNQLSPAIQRMIVAVGAAGAALRIFGGAIQALFVSIGPAGWLLAGLGLAAAAFLGLSAAANDGEAQMRRFRLEVQQLSIEQARQQLAKLKEELAGIRALSTTEIMVLGTFRTGQEVLESRNQRRQILEGRMQALEEFIAAEEKAQQVAAARRQQMQAENDRAAAAEQAKQLERAKELMDNQRQFEFEHQQTSREQFLAYLRTRQNDFEKFSSDWMALQAAIEEQQTALETEQLAAAQEIREVEIERVRMHNEQLALIHTESGNKRLEESRRFGQQLLAEQQAMTQKLVDQAMFITDALSNIGIAFVSGIQNRTNAWKDALKTFLIAAIDAVERYLVLAKIKSLLDAVVNPFAALKNVAPLILAAAGLETLKAQISAMAQGGIVTQPTLALLGESAATRPEIVAPERDFLSFSNQLIERVINERGQDPNGRRRNTVIVNNFNTPLNDRRTAERLAEDVLRPELRRENDRRTRLTR